MSYEGGRCLTNEELAQYSSGKMSRSEAQLVEQHLTMCEVTDNTCFDRVMDFGDLNVEEVVGSEDDTQ